MTQYDDSLPDAPPTRPGPSVDHNLQGVGRRGRNQLDAVAENLADWIDDISTRIAASVIGGLAAPFAAPLSDAEKLIYYTRQFFEPDGSPNLQGRVREIERLGPAGFAEVLRAVLKAHPEFRQPHNQPEPLPPLEPTPLGG